MAVQADEQVAPLEAGRIGGAAGHDARDGDGVVVRLRVEADPGAPLGLGHGLAALEQRPPLVEERRRDGQAVAPDRGEAQGDDARDAPAPVEERPPGEPGVDRWSS